MTDQNRYLALQLEGVSKSFGEHTAVSNLDLAVPRGCVYGLLGPNGSGKTTTIRMIIGILGPDSGTVTLLGRSPDVEARRRVGYLPEERGLYPKMTVSDVLVFLAQIRGIRRAEGLTRAERWLDRLGLSEWRDHRVRDLSKGMQQKVQFIGTVIHEPDLLILDEPFSGLDPINQDLLEEIVRDFRDRGTTILFSTHLMDQAERMCDHVCLISRSEKVLDGELKAIKEAEAGGVVAVRFEGDDGWIAGPEVSGIERHHGEYHLLLADGADAQPILGRAVAAGVRVERFERVVPRLHEIFVKRATGPGKKTIHA
jgi:ABC-2 type transport system ATP-binding protein